MNWDAVGAIAESLGAIAVILSLIYVAVQIRQNTIQIARGSESERLDAFERNVASGNRFRELLLVNPHLEELLLKGMDCYSDLEKAEKFRFSMLIRNLFSELQGAYVRQQYISKDSHSFDGTAKLVDELLVNPGIRQWLAGYTPDWNPEFAAFISKRVDAIDAANA